MNAEIGVALVGAHDDRPGLRDRKVRTRHARVRAQEVRPRVLPLTLGKVMDVAVLRIGADRFGKDARHVGAQLVHGRYDDVARRLVIELLDALAEVGFHDLDAAGFEKRPHVAFVGQHRLRLDQRACAARIHDLENDLVVLGSVPCPMHVNAVARRVGLEFLEVVGEVGQRVFLDLRGQRPERLPFVELYAFAVALLPQVPEPAIMEFDVILGLDEV